MLKKIFSYIYFIFSLLIVLLTLKEDSIMNFIIITSSLVFIIVLLKNRRYIFKKIFDNKVINFFIVLGIILRISLIFLQYSILYGDFLGFSLRAILFAKFGSIDSYVALFPHLITYFVGLGTIYKIFGVNYKIVIILNIFFDLLAAFFLMKLFRNKKAALVWLINPINIIWCSMCHPAVITNSLLVISIYILKNIIDKFKKNENRYLFVILLGIVLAIANLFRPIMIILIIALIIYFILNLNKNNFKQIAIIILIIMISYFGCNQLFMFACSKIIDMPITEQKIGWNVYVGSNIESNGTWRTDLQEEFNELLNTNVDSTEIQNYFLMKGIENYKSNGLVNNVKLIINKLAIFVENPAKMTSCIFNDFFGKSFSGIVLNLLEIWMSFSYYILLIFNLVIAYISLRSKECNFSTLLQLFIIGNICGHMLFEVSPRYALPLLVPYTLLLIINRDKIYNYFDEI